MNFQRITIYIATLLLIAMLLIVGIMLYRADQNAEWPPMISECPDYWKVIDTEKCENVQGLGNCPGVADFTGSKWQGQSGLKEKYNWAKKCNVVWDGITNNASLN